MPASYNEIKVSQICAIIHRSQFLCHISVLEIYGKYWKWPGDYEFWGELRYANYQPQAFVLANCNGKQQNQDDLPETEQKMSTTFDNSKAGLYSML